MPSHQQADPAVHPDPSGHLGADIEVPHIEIDESIPPRPEEDVADALRAALDQS